MKYISLLFLSFLIVSCGNKKAEKKAASTPNEEISDDIIISNTKYEIEKLASGFKFTEGPAVDGEGNVYFTDIPNNMILIWTVENKLDTLNSDSGRTNGLYFDKDGNLLACESERGRITSTTPEGKSSVIAATYDGKRFNQPNDIWPDGKGGAYFTDPKYGDHQDELDQDGMHVYYIKPDRSSIIKVCDDYEKPNGILGTPDGKILYVTDGQAKKTYKYDIQEDGTLINKDLFADLGCDGMTLDQNGNVYLTTNGESRVDIFSSQGQFLDSIPVPERPANVCFGGNENNELYITARTSLYRVKLLDAKGVD